MSEGTASASGTDQPVTPQDRWEMGDVGFDTDKRLWFVQLYNELNQSVGTYMAKSIVLKSGNAAQYEWKDAQGRAFWHVRERFFADEIDSIGIDPLGVKLTLTFKNDVVRSEVKEPPTDYSYLLYAFHLINKDQAVGNKPPLGFVEFYDARGELVRRMNNKWVIIEGVDRKSVGEYPKIRLRVERSDVGQIISSQTVLIIQGKHAQQ